MTLLINLSLARQHCRADSNDDTTLTVYLAAAERKVQDELNRNVYADQGDLDAAVDAATAGRDPIVINDAITAAILLLCGHWYANREDVAAGVSVAQMPMGAFELLKPYMSPACTANGQQS